MDKTVMQLFARSGMSLDRLRVLLETAEAGGIAKAVGKDPVRQSQYNRQLKELEDFFEVELTRRDGKCLVLTEAGEKLAEIVRQNFKALSDFAAECANRPVVYTIGAGDSLIHWKILPCMGMFQKSFPAVSIHISNMRTAQIVDGLHNLRLDFGIIRRNAAPSVFKSVSLGKMEYALYVPQQLLTASSQRTLEWVMRNLPIVGMESTGEFARKLDEIAGKSRIRVNTRIEYDSFPAVCNAVRSGDYAGILPTMAASELPADRFVCIESAKFKKIARELVLVWNPRIMRLRPASGNIAIWLEKNL